MRRSTRLVCTVGLPLGLFAPALLAAPPVFDRVPGNAIGLITTPNLNKLQKNAAAFLEAIEAPIPLPEVGDLFAQMGIEDGNGFSTDSTAAMVFIPPPPGAADEDAEPDPEQMMLVILQTNDYAKFLGNFEVKPGVAGGIDAAMLNGEDAFFKDLGGGYMAMATVRETLERAQWKIDAPVGALLGAAGESTVETSDLSIVIFAQEARKFMPQLQAAIEEQMADNPAGMAMGDLEDSPLAGFLKGQMGEDATAAVTGLKFTTQGMAVDMTMNFKEGSETAKKMAGITGSTQDLLAKLPAQDYVFAMAMDTSSEGARKVIDTAVAGLGEEGKNGFIGFLADWAKNSDGAAMTMGMPPGGIMTGLFTSTISYVRSSNPKQFVKSMQDGLAKLNGQGGQGLAMDTTYTANGAEIEGTKVDTWGIKIRMDENSDEDPGELGMALPMIFGQAGGPSGYIAQTDGGLYQTFGRNQALMNNAFNVGKGVASFTADKGLAKVAEQLPKNRIGEMYIGVRSILEAAVPLMAMADMDIEVDIPPSLPPIGAGIATDKGAMHIGVYVPAPTMKLLAGIFGQVAAAQMGEFDFEEPENKNDGQNGAGQPRF